MQRDLKAAAEAFVDLVIPRSSRSRNMASSICTAMNTLAILRGALE